jgi:DNA repair exonuclease SbcCD nuclease subunit
VKILFTADIHIKLGQKNVPVDWARNRYNLLWKQFEELQDKADVFIIGGDVFDKLPNMDELEIYFDLISHCKIPTIIYSGNHEAVKKSTTFMTNLAKASNLMSAKRNVIVIDDYYSDHGIEFVPYNKLKDFEQSNPWPEGGKILCTHVRGEIPPHVMPEVNLDIFKSWDVVLAGDLHSYENCQRNILYPGSPVTTSFHRDVVQTGVILLDTETLEHEWLKLELPQLIRKTVAANDAKPSTEYHHTIYQVEGDLQELGELEDSELIDKKVIKRSSDVQLMLDNDMTLVQEVKEYLQYILELPQETIDKAILEVQNNLDKIEHD